MVPVDRRGVRAVVEGRRITVRGRVQGVGFRPHVARLARRLGIRGGVQNTMDGVLIRAEGTQEALEAFIRAIVAEAPKAARIDAMEVAPDRPEGALDFRILPSRAAGRSTSVIPVDTAVCEACLAEMRDPHDRRYRYPFITCTQCGPRYTVIEALPYDREQTVMRAFSLCPDCAREYGDAEDRRYHAETIACPACGPAVRLIDAGGRPIPGDPIAQASALLRAGKIVAVKGLGGYHLACDATREEAVFELRRRKRRPRKPLAVMAASVEAARGAVRLSPEEEALLASPAAPIVVAERRDGGPLAPSVAPGLRTVGVMLPYTPLHHLLFDAGAPALLVMTSANLSGLPIFYRDEEALEGLREIADAFLVHDRPIAHPLDDSVVRLVGGDIDFLRRSRGYVPDPLPSPFDVDGVVGLGSEENNAFAFGRGTQLFVGPHIGDMETVEVEERYIREFEHFHRWLGVDFNIIAMDRHPLFATRRIAERLKAAFPDVEIVEVQHHHAHMAACMGENGLEGPAFGIILDGTGYGTDGAIWGFEVLYGSYDGFRRVAHLRYTPLPGGDKAVREPWRNALGMLVRLFGREEALRLLEARFPERRTALPILASLVERRELVAEAGTCGRLFDAASALLGLAEVAGYDGEPAILLSERVDADAEYAPYAFAIEEGDPMVIDMTPMLRALLHEYGEGRPIEAIAGRFHATIVASLVEVIRRARMRHPAWSRDVVLSGGSFHNPYLRVHLRRALRALGMNVYTHRLLPPGDGGLAAGQIWVAARTKRAR
ncbi:MAG: carbamoyltransferase HypF [Hydrogenibacillus schlegelii]|uniref:Carbamoyltransferase n=1 Tax=Hydrogenibacillus schlegelii TaxID=1484 RepID=A0A947D260_HYDSH|nr:carbamoyltransferase HypF [Hydrogenibacillus schlegelii]MBT9282716.1 carbamoyltransferase HypF [Hydrogenibacillus schlegelii]